jgi:hypothetical protein
MPGKPSVSATLDALRVTIVRTPNVVGALDVTINPDAVASLSAAPTNVRVFLVIDGVATIIYDDLNPREG